MPACWPTPTPEQPKHTPGPWKAHSASLCDNTLVVTAPHPTGDGYERICVVREGVLREYSDEDDRAQANAALMAAAPELLASLVEFVQCNDGEHTLEMYERARAAIRKADNGH